MQKFHNNTPPTTAFSITLLESGAPFWRATFFVNVLIFRKVYVHADTYSFSNRLARRKASLETRASSRETEVSSLRRDSRLVRGW